LQRIFTLRDIQADEKLTFDYGFNIMKTTFQKCLCIAPSCRDILELQVRVIRKKYELY